MLLFRLTDTDRYAVAREDGAPRWLLGSPWIIPPDQWQLGDLVPRDQVTPLAPVQPSKIVGIGRNYVAHAAELGNPMPKEPLIFLKAPSSILDPGSTIVLPPESDRIELEGEIALVVGQPLHRGNLDSCSEGILGVTAANDVTARDLQRSDKTFARGKSFDTFCPVGPSILVGPDLSQLTVETRLNGEVVQEGSVTDMAWGPVELVEYVARHMTLFPGDLVLTGTPAGVTPLADGDEVEVEVAGVGILRNRVAAL